MYMRGPGLSGQEIEDLKRRQARRDYSVKPRSASQRGSLNRAEVEQIRQALLRAVRGW